MKFLFQKVLNKFIYRPYLKLKLKKVGKNFKLGYYSEILNPSMFSIGENFYAGPFSYFGTNRLNPVTIGDYVMFGPRCIIQGGNHDTKYEGFMFNNKDINHMSSEIVVENGVWIGSNTTLLSGANIGEGSIVGAMSLVNKRIPPYVIAGGVPVKVIKQRYETKAQLSNAIQVTKSKYSIETILDEHKKLGFSYL